jgi:two-component system response regulator PilR (NtrC family)
MNEHTALIIDDEPDIRELLELTLMKMGITACTAEDIGSARNLLLTGSFDLCLTDMRLPDGNGIELIEYMQENHPNIPVAMITAHGNMESAIQALKAGAFDFVSKPVDLNVLRNLVNTALKLADKPTSSGTDQGQVLLGVSTQIEKIRQTIDKLARSQTPVYISGESGCGKELAAKLIHDKGPRSDHAFVPVNCGAIPEELMESEFFGHKKGSFTGAVSDKEGLFQAANKGTLFLDEIAELPLHMQVKLLRAIQEKSIRPVGANKEIPVDVRILSATHQNLDDLVAQNKFRQDLYYRINVIELHMPALRERPDDINILCEHLLSHLAEQNQVSRPELTPDAIAALKNYSFPGNVRELENILERAMTLSDGKAITAEDLHLPRNDSSPAEELPNASLDSHLDNIEKEAIKQALEQARYNKTAAAKILGISFRQLRYRLKKLGME